MIANRVVRAKRIRLIINLVTQESKKLLLVAVVVDNAAAPRSRPYNSQLSKLSQKLDAHEICVLPIVSILDSSDVVVVIEDPLAARASRPTMLQQRSLFITGDA